MEIIDKIRQIANIVDIASQYTTLKKRGRKNVGLCPFHPEKDPSFTVDDEKQLFHCFGCGVGGDIFTLVMEKENISFPEALRYLAEKYNLPLPSQKKLSPQFLKLEEQLFKINENALAFFKKNLFNTSEGQKVLEYLNKRNISVDTIQKLKIGYALNSWTSLLDFFQEKGVLATLLEKAGLVLPSQKKDGFYDRFRGRIIFPIFNLTGKVVAFGGRTFIDAEPKYLNSPDTPIYTKGELLYGLNFTKDSIREKGEVILVEGYTDFAALYQAGFTNSAASLGTSLTPNQVSLAIRFAPRIIVNFDSDSAGKSAALRAISLCLEKGAQIKVLTLPEELDPDSFLKKYGTEKYKSLLEKSTPGLKALIESYLQEGRMDIPEEKAIIVRNVVKEIDKIPDSVVRSEYLKQASEFLRVEEEIMRNITQPKSSEKKSDEKGHFLPAEKILLQILMENKTIAPLVYPEMREEDFQGLNGGPIFKVLIECFNGGKDPSIHELKPKIEPLLFSSLSKSLMEKEGEPTLEEALECLHALREFSLQNQAEKIKAEITQLERKGASEKLPSLIRQLQDIKKQHSSLSKRSYKNLSYNRRNNFL